jgi:hypothetical protein
VGAARASLPGEDESDAAFMPCTMLSVNFNIFFTVYFNIFFTIMIELESKIMGDLSFDSSKFATFSSANSRLKVCCAESGFVYALMSLQGATEFVYHSAAVR